MAILQMERIHLSAMKRDRKKILELLQRRGIVEIADAGSADDVFQKADTSVTRSLLTKNADTAERAIDILNTYDAEDKPSFAFLRGRAGVSVAENDAFYDKREEVLRAAQRVQYLEREIADAKASILRDEALEEALLPWLALPVPQTFSGTKKTAAFIGAVEGETTESALRGMIAEACPDLASVHVEVVSATKAQTCFYVLVPKADEGRADAALRTMGFTRPASPSSRPPEQERRRLAAQKREAQRAIEAAEKEIVSYAGMRADFRFLADHMTMRAEKYGVIENLVQSKHVFVLDGYVPVKVAPALEKELTAKFDCVVDFSPIPQEDDEPVLLHNNWFSEPLEPILESYALPAKGEIDPTTIMSFFYIFMFGMLFSDAGYGFIMAAACGIAMLVFKNMEPNWSRNVRLFFWCGISTIVWGVLFSSYFGDAITVFTTRYLGNPVVIPPLWFNPLSDPMKLLLFCLSVGIVHLTTGMVLKGVTLARQKAWLDILYDVVFSLVFLYSILLVLLSSDMFLSMSGSKLNTPPIVSTICLGIAGACCVGVVLTGGRESKNWFKRLLKGAYAMYNMVAGWLSDILSYSRLLALGLATGVIASVINAMGSMGSGVVGAIIFCVVFVVGQTVGFGLNVLGAYVHSNRLEYVEFFSKFYEGGGRKFTPFGIHTKYYKIEEDTQHV